MYFDALIKFGIPKLIDACGSDRSRIIELTGCLLSVGCREKHLDFCREIIDFLNKGTKSTQQPDIQELDTIIHYTVENHPIFNQTALNYANQNDDKVAGLMLLQLEKHVHQDINKGLSCIKKTIERGPLLSWVIQTYPDLFP